MDKAVAIERTDQENLFQQSRRKSFGQPRIVSLSSTSSVMVLQRSRVQVWIEEIQLPDHRKDQNELETPSPISKNDKNILNF